MSLRIFFVSLFIIRVFLTQAQDVESMAKARPLNFSGNISAQFLGYSTTRDRPSRDPFVWTLSGSATLDIYGFSVPFSFVFSQKERRFRQPFNQFGLSPRYKWLTVHAGYRNLRFSDYTLGGHTFLGAGVELNPGKFRFGFVYGRFLKAVENDSMNLEYIVPAYKRTGYAVRVGYGTPGNFVDLILFKAGDDTTSIVKPDLSAGVLPADNLVVGIRSFQRFLKHFSFDLDFGLSTYTANLYAGSEGVPAIPATTLISRLMTINNSTRVNWAGHANLSYSQGNFGLRVQYKRIEPDYQTMGAYFFTNDREIVTLIPSLSLFKRKLHLRGTVGFQRNNLFNDKLNRTFRNVNSLTVSFRPATNTGINLSYMNYRINQRRNPLIIKDFVDSLQMKQISNSITANISQRFGSKELQQTVTGGISYQKFIDDNPNTEIYNYSTSQSPYFSYRLNNTVAKYSVYARLNYNTFQSRTTEQARFGLTLGGTKRLAGNKFYLNMSASYYQNKRNREAYGTTGMVRARLNYRLRKRHNFNMSLNFIDRRFDTDTENNFHEFLFRFGYFMRI